MAEPANDNFDPTEALTKEVDPPPVPLAGDGQTALAGDLADELAAAWHRGEHIRVEALLEREPDLWDNRDAVFRLICEEVCLREEAGMPVDPLDFVTRFPRWPGELEALLDCHRLLQASPEPDAVAADLDDFEILAELGKGAQGQVFLAKQRSLGDRPVVLKITSCHGREHLSLARLQHTHIVPLYWVNDDPVRDRRVLSMPYFGSVTLGCLLGALKNKPVVQRSGQDLLDALDTAQRSASAALAGQGPARAFLARASYVQALCWIGACLADALQYAHDRGLVHLDVKPSNILLAGAGQPMLLDFHLAREPVRPGGPRPRSLGGTPAYMAPEQRAAVDDLVAGRPIKEVVDGRADVFSLGLVLYHLLGGPVPLVSQPRLD